MPQVAPEKFCYCHYLKQYNFCVYKQPKCTENCERVIKRCGDFSVKCIKKRLAAGQLSALPQIPYLHFPEGEWERQEVRGTGERGGTGKGGERREGEEGGKREGYIRLLEGRKNLAPRLFLKASTYALNHPFHCHTYTCIRIVVV